MGRKSAEELDLAALRAQAQKKPRTKAGQIRQAWPEIRDLLATGHSLKDVWAWLKEIGIAVPYTRLSEYVNQMRRRDADEVSGITVSTRRAADVLPTEPRATLLRRTETPWRTCTEVRLNDQASITAPPCRRMRKT